MKRSVRWGAPVLATLVTAGCYRSHTGALDGAGQPDGGRDGGGSFDARRDSSFRPDASGPQDASECERVAGFRRCDEACPLPCTGLDGPCRQFGVCVRRHESGADDSCHFREWGGSYPFTGRPCAIYSGSGAAGDPWNGVGMPPEFCLAAPGAGLDIECRWSDGTRLVTGPPPGDCPASDPRDPFCGGSCGDEICPGNGPCVGVSDTRSHGVCGRGIPFCWEGNADHFGQQTILDACAERFGGDECACLVLRPQGFPSELESGWPMLGSACRAYRDRFADGSRCVDARWRTLP